MGLTLGQTQADVLSTKGETGFTSGPAIDSITYILYNIHDASGVLAVRFHAGRVSSIALGRSIRGGGAPSDGDPHGITLAMSRSDVAAKLGKGSMASANGFDTYEYMTPDGLTWRYSFRGETMQWIYVALSNAMIEALPRAPTFKLHAGTSFDDALVDGAADDPSGVANEGFYLHSQRCPSGPWQETKQALVKHNNRQYDVPRYRAQMERRDYCTSTSPPFLENSDSDPSSKSSTGSDGPELALSLDFARDDSRGA
ncbi:MAG TPA: hypothetical protein VGG22_14845 [Candidatus Baltobacteraceae bacterium]|jgi:hypothetical protein